MVSRQAFVNKIRELKYTFKAQQPRTELWRRVGGQHRILVPRCDKIEDEYIRNQLRQTGLMSAQEIEEFIGAYQVT